MKTERSAGAIIYKKENNTFLFLLLKKTNGELDFAKGHVEEGETDKIAAMREIFEETGLKPEFLPNFNKEIKYTFKRNKNNITKTVKYYIAKTDTKKIIISKEHSMYEWLSKDEIFKKIKYKDIIPLLNEIFLYVNNYEALEDLNNEYRKLPESIEQWALSYRLVPGSGPSNAKIMIIGQAPGKQEDEKLLPFIGRSGMLLNEKIKRLGVKREDIYITSCVQFFPPKNRMPTTEEIEICKPFLFKQIDIIKPKYIITLGSLAAKVLLNVEKVSIMHGKLIEKNGITFMITFHPAAGLRFKRIKNIMDNDFDIFREYLESSLYAKKQKIYNNKDN